MNTLIKSDSWLKFYLHLYGFLQLYGILKLEQCFSNFSTEGLAKTDG